MNPAIINTIARQQQEVAQFEKDFLCSGAPDKLLAYNIADLQQALLSMKFRLESLLADRPELFLVVVPENPAPITLKSIPASHHVKEWRERWERNMSEVKEFEESKKILPQTSEYALTPPSEPESSTPQNFHESDRQEVPEPVVSINNLPKENIETIRE